MRVITDTSVQPWPGERSVITIGAYDGVHRGHQAVIAEVRRRAAAIGARSVVITFDPHPASVVRPESAPRLLTDTAQKLELLEQTGVDGTVVISFDAQQSQESPLDFAQRVIVGCLSTAAIVVGSDFHFGKGRQGNVETLREFGLGAGFDVVPMPLLPRHDGPGEPVSSTAIRRAMAGGQVELAAELMGHAFEARGVVVKGDQRGRQLGFPTANVEVPSSICLPADGVYAGWYVRPDGTRQACAMNLGRRPTFYEHANVSLLEAHLLNFAGDLYGESARVQFTHFLRSERKFDGIQNLIAQLQLDIQHAHAVLRGHSN